MKKGLVLCLCFLGVLVFTGALASCANPAGGNADPIVGTWVLGSASYTFTSGAAFTVASPSVSISGNYTKTATALHLTISGFPFQDFTYAFGSGNNTLTLTGTGTTAGLNMTLTRQ